MTQTVYTVAIVINLVCAAFNIWMIRRNRRRYDEAVEQLMNAVTPAVAFCAFMKVAPGVPDDLRKLAAEAIPKNVEITVTTGPTSERVH